MARGEHFAHSAGAEEALEAIFAGEHVALAGLVVASLRHRRVAPAGTGSSGRDSPRWLCRPRHGSCDATCRDVRQLLHQRHVAGRVRPLSRFTFPVDAPARGRRLPAAPTHAGPRVSPILGPQLVPPSAAVPRRTPASTRILVRPRTVRNQPRPQPTQDLESPPTSFRSVIATGQRLDPEARKRILRLVAATWSTRAPRPGPRSSRCQRRTPCARSSSCACRSARRPGRGPRRAPCRSRSPDRARGDGSP